MHQRLPLHEVHLAAGARLKPSCGWELPTDYGDAAAEYLAVRRAVGLLDRGDHGVVEVTGRDRATFLHALLTNEVKALAPGQGCEAALLDVHGKVQTVLALWVLDDRILLVTPPGGGPGVVEALDRYLFSEKVVLRDATGEHAMLVLAGPEADGTARRVLGEAPSGSPWAHAAVTREGLAARLVRGAGATGEAEVWVVCAAGDGPRAWERLAAAGARPVGLTARESLRIETGTPLPGHDVDGTVLLPEIPTAHLVSESKGCYPGQEVVVRVRDRGHVNRHLRGLVLDDGARAGDGVPAGAQVVAGDAVIGRVTSSAWSFGLGRPIALGFVRREHAEPGRVVSVRTAAGVLPATVSALPFSR